MDYEKKYKEALERAKDLHDNHALDKPFIYKTCENIFPELKESEDERIRKKLLEYLQRCVKCNPLTEETEKIMKDSIAWLEKQGEQKPADKVEPKFNMKKSLTDKEKSYGIM